jgi:hypothetical protein
MELIDEKKKYIKKSRGTVPLSSRGYAERCIHISCLQNLYYALPVASESPDVTLRSCRDTRFSAA